MNLNTSQIIIRAAVKEDARTIARLYQLSSDGVADYIWSKLATLHEELLDVGEKRYQREGFSFSYENCTVVEYRDAIIGMMVAFPMIVDPDYVEEDPVLVPYNILEEDQSFYICGIALFPDYRGQGIGQQLLKLAEDKAINLSLKKLSLIVFLQNTDAYRLYQKLGYIEIARQRIIEHPLIHLSGDAILMVKLLD